MLPDAFVTCLVRHNCRSHDAVAVPVCLRFVMMWVMGSLQCGLRIGREAK